MKKLVLTCSEAVYDLYQMLGKYFEVEIIDNNNNEMGILDNLEILIEPISKTIEVLGNIIITFIHSNSCTITIKNGDKEVSFDGRIKDLNNIEVMELLNKIIEG